jgi:hypothetical protein
MKIFVIDADVSLAIGNPDQGFLYGPLGGIAFSVRCLMADADEDGHEQACAESRTQALEDMKLGAFGDHVDRPQLQWPPPILGEQR